MSAPASKSSASRPLEGPARAAALLMAMGQPVAARVMKHFDPEEIRLITKAVTDLKGVAAPQIESLIEDFASEFASGAKLFGNAEEVEKMLDGVLPPEQIGEIMADVLGNASRSVWDRIANAPESQIAAYLAKEHPQTAALILSKVKSGCAAKVMGHLPAQLRNQLLRRMLTLKPVTDETMRMVEQAMHEDFTANFSRSHGSDSHAKMAEIINKMERDHMEDVLNALAEARPKSAEILKGLLFTFEDIVKLTPKARTALFDKVPNDKTVMALKGTAEDFREVVLSSLSTRVRRMVEQELSSSEPAPQRDVSEARRVVTELALDMAGKGEIALNSDEEEGAYVQ